MAAPVGLLCSTGTKGIVHGDTPMMCNEELTGTSYDDICFQRVIVEEMGELLPAKLLAECDLSHGESILEIGSGQVNGCERWHVCIRICNASASTRTNSW